MFEAWQNENGAWLVRFGLFKIDVVDGSAAAHRLANALNAAQVSRELAKRLDSEDWTVPGSRSWSDLWGYNHEFEPLQTAGKPLSEIQRAAFNLSAIVARLSQ